MTTFDEIDETYRRVVVEQRTVLQRIDELEDELTAAKLRLQAVMDARKQLRPMRDALGVLQEDPLGVGEGPKP